MHLKYNKRSPLILILMSYKLIKTGKYRSHFYRLWVQFCMALDRFCIFIGDFDFYYFWKFTGIIQNCIRACPNDCYSLCNFIFICDQYLMTFCTKSFFLQLRLMV